MKNSEVKQNEESVINENSALKDVEEKNSEERVQNVSKSMSKNKDGFSLNLSQKPDLSYKQGLSKLNELMLLFLT